MRYIAHFKPQVWIDDYPFGVDAQGPQTWDCTAYLEQLFQEDPRLFRANINQEIEHTGAWLDDRDLLIEDPAAPAWIRRREHRGPFTIIVQMVEHDAW